MPLSNLITDKPVLISSSFKITFPNCVKSNSNAAPGVFVGAAYFSYGSSPNFCTVSYCPFFTCSTTQLNFNLSISGMGLSSQRSTRSRDILSLSPFCQINAPSQPFPNGIPSSQRFANESKTRLCSFFGCDSKEGTDRKIRFINKRNRRFIGRLFLFYFCCIRWQCWYNIFTGIYLCCRK